MPQEDQNKTIDDQQTRVDQLDQTVDQKVQLDEKDYAETFLKKVDQFQTSVESLNVPNDLKEKHLASVGEFLKAVSPENIDKLAAELDAKIADFLKQMEQVGKNKEYKIVGGDTLSQIARRCFGPNGERLSWKDLYEANKDALRSGDPNRIFIGENLKMPEGYFYLDTRALPDFAPGAPMPGEVPAGPAPVGVAPDAVSPKKEEAKAASGAEETAPKAAQAAPVAKEKEPKAATSVKEKPTKKAATPDKASVDPAKKAEAQPSATKKPSSKELTVDLPAAKKALDTALEKAGRIENRITIINRMLDSMLATKRQYEADIKKGGMFEYALGGIKETYQRGLDQQFATISKMLVGLRKEVGTDKTYDLQIHTLVGRFGDLFGQSRLQSTGLGDAMKVSTVDTWKAFASGEMGTVLWNYGKGVLEGTLHGALMMLDPRTYWAIFEAIGKGLGVAAAVAFETGMNPGELKKKYLAATEAIGEKIGAMGAELAKAPPEQMGKMVGKVVGEVVGMIYGGAVAGRVLKEVGTIGKAVAKAGSGEGLAAGKAALKESAQGIGTSLKEGAQTLRHPLEAHREIKAAKRGTKEAARELKAAQKEADSLWAELKDAQKGLEDARKELAELKGTEGVSAESLKAAEQRVRNLEAKVKAYEGPDGVVGKAQARVKEAKKKLSEAPEKAKAEQQKRVQEKAAQKKRTAEARKDPRVKSAEQQLASKKAEIDGARLDLQTSEFSMDASAKKGLEARVKQLEGEVKEAESALKEAKTAAKKGPRTPELEAAEKRLADARAQVEEVQSQLATHDYGIGGPERATLEARLKQAKSELNAAEKALKKAEKAAKKMRGKGTVEAEAPKTEAPAVKESGAPAEKPKTPDEAFRSLAETEIRTCEDLASDLKLIDFENAISRTDPESVRVLFSDLRRRANTVGFEGGKTPTLLREKLKVLEEALGKRDPALFRKTQKELSEALNGRAESLKKAVADRAPGVKSKPEAEVKPEPKPEAHTPAELEAQIAKKQQRIEALQKDVDSIYEKAADRYGKKMTEAEEAAVRDAKAEITRLQAGIEEARAAAAKAPKVRAKPKPASTETSFRESSSTGDWMEGRARARAAKPNAEPVVEAPKPAEAPITKAAPAEAATVAPKKVPTMADIFVMSPAENWGIILKELAPSLRSAISSSIEKISAIMKKLPSLRGVSLRGALDQIGSQLSKMRALLPRIPNLALRSRLGKMIENAKIKLGEFRARAVERRVARAEGKGGVKAPESRTTSITPDDLAVAEKTGTEAAEEIVQRGRASMERSKKAVEGVKPAELGELRVSIAEKTGEIKAAESRLADVEARIKKMLDENPAEFRQRQFAKTPSGKEYYETVPQKGSPLSKGWSDLHMEKSQISKEIRGMEKTRDNLQQQLIKKERIVANAERAGEDFIAAMNGEIQSCETFIQKVKSADFAKCKRLKEAAPDIDLGAVIFGERAPGARVKFKSELKTFEKALNEDNQLLFENTKARMQARLEGEKRAYEAARAESGSVARPAEQPAVVEASKPKPVEPSTNPEAPAPAAKEPTNLEVKPVNPDAIRASIIEQGNQIRTVEADLRTVTTEINTMVSSNSKYFTKKKVLGTERYVPKQNCPKALREEWLGLQGKSFDISRDLLKKQVVKLDLEAQLKVRADPGVKAKAAEHRGEDLGSIEDAAA